MLILIGLVAGLIAGISPCILPILPVILVAGATTDSGETSGQRNRRPYKVIAGLVLSFSVFTLAGSSLLSLLGLPQDFLRNVGLVILVVVGLGLVVPTVGHLLERPFARLAGRQPKAGTGGFMLGTGLGVLFVPCAGPVLAVVTLVGATHQIGVGTVVLTVAFAVGTAIPLLVFALAGQRLTQRVKAFRRRAGAVRRVGGVVLIAMALALAFDLTNGLQTAVPGYTSALQRSTESSPSAKKRLAALTPSKRHPTPANPNPGQATPPGSLADCTDKAQVLQQCGQAPDFEGISGWLNTGDGKALTLGELRGKVVLIDFWTYSCINCQRTLPHVEAWDRAYRPNGLVVVGVHTPEFAFEHVTSNVAHAAGGLGVHYPIAIDNDITTWRAYDNHYWPAEYLIDASGQIRHVHFGEGEYGLTESLVRQLLTEADPTRRLPPVTGVDDTTPAEQATPESYLGYQRMRNLAAGSNVVNDQVAQYSFPESLPENQLALEGEWTIGAEHATAGADARLELQYHARNVFLVLGGSGTAEVAVNGSPMQTIVVSGPPNLYTLVQKPSPETSTVVLSLSPGVEAYDFTFG